MRHRIWVLTFLNDRDHVTELNNTRPKQPFFFLKPSSSLLYPGAGPVVRPRGVDLHYEIELALIIGKDVKDLEPSDEQGAIDAIESAFPKPSQIYYAKFSRLCFEYRHDGP